MDFFRNRPVCSKKKRAFARFSATAYLNDFLELLERKQKGKKIITKFH